MKNKLFAMVLVFSMVSLVGCGFSESGELMSGARKYIENGEYDKAMTNLSKVIAEDESNTEARGMYYQALKLKKAVIYDSRLNYELEIKELNDLLNDDSGSAKVRTQAEEMLDKAQKAFASQKKATITRKENAKKTAEENKNRYATSSTYGTKYTYNNKWNQKSTQGINQASGSTKNYSSGQSGYTGTNQYGTQSNLSGQNSGYANQQGTQGAGSTGAGQYGGSTQSAGTTRTQ